MLLLTRTGPSRSLSLATLDAVGRMKLDPVLRRTGAGELGTATAKCAVSLVSGIRKKKKRRSIMENKTTKRPHNKRDYIMERIVSGTNINRKQISLLIRTRRMWRPRWSFTNNIRPQKESWTRDLPLRNDVVRPFTGAAAVLTEPVRIKDVLDGPFLWALDKVEDIPPGT